MKVKISPAYLGLKASQSKRSKCEDRRVTRNIWTTKDGLRIPVVDMDDKHLISTIYILYQFARRVREKAREKEEQIQDWFGLFNWDNIDLDDGAHWFGDDIMGIASMTMRELLHLWFPCYPTMVIEGYKRGFLHASGYPNEKGLTLIGKSKELEYGKDEI